MVSASQGDYLVLEDHAQIDFKERKRVPLSLADKINDWHQNWLTAVNVCGYG